MLDKPRKRICPSDSLVACSNSRRHAAGLKKGSSPSSTSISAQAASSNSQKLAPTGGYFFAGAAVEDEPRMARKNSLLGSSTITSPLLRKAAR